MGRVDEAHDLGLVAKAFGKERTYGPVDLPAGEHFLFAGPSFALDEAARNASARVGKLPVLNGERKKVNAFFGVRRSDGRA